MQTHTILLSLVTLGLGAAGGTLLSSPTATPGSLSADASDWRAAQDVLQTQIQQLRRQNDDLLAAVRQLQAAPPREPSEVPAEALEVPEAAAPIRALVSEPERAAPAATGDWAIRDQVRSVVEEIRALEEEEEEERRAEKLARFFEKNLARAAEELGLNAYQTGEFEKALVAEHEAIQSIKDRYSGSEDDDGRRLETVAARDQSKGLLATFMNAEQLDQYDERYGNGKALYGKKAKNGSPKAKKGKKKAKAKS